MNTNEISELIKRSKDKEREYEPDELASLDKEIRLLFERCAAQARVLDEVEEYFKEATTSIELMDEKISKVLARDAK